MTNAEMKAEAIEHWKRVCRDPVGRFRDHEGINIRDCPFCRVYYGPNCWYNDDSDGSDGSEHCIDCPIHLATGKRMCSDTPYDQAYSSYCSLKLHSLCYADDIDPVEWLNSIVDFRKAARAEIAFLESLEVQLDQNHEH